MPIDTEQYSLLEKNFIELFLEEDPALRTQGYSTLEDAIQAHITEFN
jgi:hypothetical protein